MVVTANTTKYTIENDLTKKEKKPKNKQTQTNNSRREAGRRHVALC